MLEPFQSPHFIWLQESRSQQLRPWRSLHCTWAQVLWHENNVSVWIRVTWNQNCFDLLSNCWAFPSASSSARHQSYFWPLVVTCKQQLCRFSLNARNSTECHPQDQTKSCKSATCSFSCEAAAYKLQLYPSSMNDKAMHDDARRA